MTACECLVNCIFSGSLTAEFCQRNLPQNHDALGSAFLIDQFPVHKMDCNNVVILMANRTIDDRIPFNELVVKIKSNNVVIRNNGRRIFCVLLGASYIVGPIL